jgi:hypothetical protein
MFVLLILQFVIAAIAQSLPGPVAIGFVIQQAATVTFSPIVAVIATLLYYDARIRNEGFDIEIMSKELSEPAATAAPSPERVQLPEQVIRDTVTAVFSNRAYGHPSLLRRIGSWLLNWLAYLLERLPTRSVSPGAFWTITIVIAVLLVALLLRYALPLGTLRPGRGQQAGTSGRAAIDYWELARQSAARGDYTGAAHALYASLLHTIAGGGETSSTTRRRSAITAASSRHVRLRASAGFANLRAAIETVIYGIGFATAKGSSVCSSWRSRS